MPNIDMNKSKKRGKTLLVVMIAFLLLGALSIYLLMLANNRRFPLKYQQEVTYWSEHYQVDPYIVYAVIKTESNFDPTAVSSANARGLMQMTSDTFDWIKSKIAPDEAIVFDDLYNPDVSIRFGVCYLAFSLERYGQDLSTAAAAYHSGWGTVDSLLSKPEHSPDGVRLTSFPYNQMNHYVYKINKHYQEYLKMYPR